MSVPNNSMNTGIDSISNQVAELSIAKRKLLDLRLKKRVSEEAQPSIQRREKSSGAPLSFAQQRLWFLEQLQPDTSTYILANAVPMRGPVDVKVLEQALNEIARRHEITRTVFPIIEGSPVQVIVEPGLLQLPFVDLTGLPEPERQRQIVRLINEIRRPFDLQRGPLLRVTLLRFSEEQHVLYIALHHIIADGWSLGILARELDSLYGAFSVGEPSPLPEPPIQYGDFALWQREWLRSDVMAGQLAYWKKQLTGAPTLNLTGNRGPRKLSLKLAAEMKKLSTELSTKVKALAQREGATLFMTLLAAFQVLLARYSGQYDVVVGSPVAGRTQMETESLIGCFVNMLVLRSDLSGEPSFREVLRRVREMAFQAYENQQTPFEMLVEELRPQRDLSRSPLFQVMFALESSKSVQAATRDVFYSLPIDAAAKYDLTLNVAELEPGLLCSFDYDTGLFESSTIRRMMGHFEVLLESITRNQEQPISELLLLSPAERHQLVVEWNETGTDPGKTVCVHQLFESQARRVGNRLAVVHERERVTYRELNRRANQLAHRLRKRGVGRGQLVGICLERSVDMVVSLLGILKTGAAYVPLDPGYPAERLKFMQHDAGLKLVITQDHLCEMISEGVEAISVDRGDSSEATVEMIEEVRGEDLAYVIYTSGSTGNPKGVAVQHSSVVNLLQSMKVEPGITEEDRLLAVTTLSFDIAALELFLPLTVGAQVVIASREIAADPGALAKKIKQSAITMMQATPATWQMLVEAGWKGDECLKILCGGEALTRGLANELVDRAAQVWNMYGPTETTIWSSTLRVERESGPVCLGRGIGNTEFYVLDDHRQLVPIGVAGELYIGGTGVARGYWNRPELTAERFVPNPFRKEEDNHKERLYRTGDLVRYLEDGKLEYLGRIDHQVKIRGFRIELGEIEAVLREAGVREAVVVEDENEIEQKRLIGYVVGGDLPSNQELRQQLKQKLPEYMVPAMLVQLDQLPLTPSGKVDRGALPKPELAERKAETGENLTQDGLQLQLTSIWERLLGQPVGVQDDFFELGGHSLLAVRLFIEMEKVFGRTLPLATLFTAPTIEQLAAILRQQGWEAPGSSLVALQPLGSLLPFFCIHSLGANLVSYHRLAQHLGKEQPFYGLQPQGLDGKREPHTRVEDMAAHYIKEIRSVQSQGPYSLGGVCLGGVVAFEMAQQLLAEREQVSRLVLIDSHFPSYPRHYLAGAFGSRGVALADSYLGDLLALSGKEKLRYILTRLSRLMARGAGYVKEAGDRLQGTRRNTAVLPAVLQKVKEANALAEASYTPRYYPGHIVQLWCTEMPTRSYKDRRLAWSEVAGAGLEVHTIPGNHMTILEEPHIRVLAESLRGCLQNPRAIGQVA